MFQRKTMNKHHEHFSTPLFAYYYCKAKTGAWYCSVFFDSTIRTKCDQNDTQTQNKLGYAFLMETIMAKKQIKIDAHGWWLKFWKSFNNLWLGFLDTNTQR